MKDLEVVPVPDVPNFTTWLTFKAHWQLGESQLHGTTTRFSWQQTDKETRQLLTARKKPCLQQLTAKFLSPYLKQISKNQLPPVLILLQHCFLSRLDEKMPKCQHHQIPVVITEQTDPEAEEVIISPAKFLLAQSRHNFKGVRFMPSLCNHFHQLFTLRNESLHKSVRGIHELCSSSYSTEVSSRKETGQLTVEQHLKYL